MAEITGNQPVPDEELSFNDKLTLLVVTEIADAKGDPEKLDYVIERLCSLLSLAMRRRVNENREDFRELLRKVMPLIVEKANIGQSVTDWVRSLNDEDAKKH